MFFHRIPLALGSMRKRITGKPPRGESKGEYRRVWSLRTDMSHSNSTNIHKITS